MYLYEHVNKVIQHLTLIAFRILNLSSKTKSSNEVM